MNVSSDAQALLVSVSSDGFIKVWELPASFVAEGEETTKQGADDFIASANTHARITCLAIAGLQIHEAVQPVVTEEQAAATVQASAASEGEAQKAKRPKKSQEVEEVAAGHVSALIPEAPKGQEEDDERIVKGMIKQSQKRIRKEQAKRMYAMKKKEAKLASKGGY